MLNFYPRPPRGGRLRPSWCSRTLRNFYPRPPRGGRRRDFLRRDFGDVISIHALREEGDLQRGRLASAKEDFYPRPPRGGRPSATGRLTVHSRFLSTPSARRATFLLFFFGEFIEISIHALREEGDIRFRPVSTTHCNFYPRPPRGGRPRAAKWCAIIYGFLSTPSARRATRGAARREGGWKFLSTPSARRATTADGNGQWHDAISIHALREEGDVRRAARSAARTYFYPRPPRGGRRTSLQSILCDRYFYPRPPRGGRPRRFACEWPGTDFYPRPPRGGRPQEQAKQEAYNEFLSTPSARRATTDYENQLDDFQKFLSTPSARRATAKTETKSLFSNKLYNILHEFRRALIYNGSKNYPNHAK